MASTASALPDDIDTLKAMLVAMATEKDELAASPTFALMAWISANDMQRVLCVSESGVLSLRGMALMYLLMSLFHLSPWLKLVAALSRRPVQSTLQLEGNRPCIRPSFHAKTGSPRAERFGQGSTGIGVFRHDGLESEASERMRWRHGRIGAICSMTHNRDRLRWCIHFFSSFLRRRTGASRHRMAA